MADSECGVHRTGQRFRLNMTRPRKAQPEATITWTRPPPPRSAGLRYGTAGRWRGGPNPFRDAVNANLAPSPDVIRLAVVTDVRDLLVLRNLGNLLFERGLDTRRQTRRP